MNKAELNIELCAGRHEIAQAVDGSMFPDELKPSDIEQIEQTADRYVSDAVELGIKQINLYVTGLTVALVAAIKAAIKHGIGLTLWHYDRDSDGYLPQAVTEYREPEDLIDTILRLYDVLIAVESDDQRRAIKTAIERLKKDGSE